MNRKLVLIEEDAYAAWELKRKLENSSYEVLHARSLALGAKLIMEKLGKFDLLVVGPSHYSVSGRGFDFASGSRRLLPVIDGLPALISFRDLAGASLVSNRKYLDTVKSLSFSSSDAGKIRERILDHDRIALATGRSVDAEEFFREGEGWRSYLTTRLPVCDQFMRPFCVLAVSIELAGPSEGTSSSGAASSYGSAIPIEEMERPMLVESDDGPILFFSVPQGSAIGAKCDEA